MTKRVSDLGPDQFLMFSPQVPLSFVSSALSTFCLHRASESAFFQLPGTLYFRFCSRPRCRRSKTSQISSSLRELSYLANPSQCSGPLPSDLTGTYFWLIPSPSPPTSSDYEFPPPEHPFDGDGYILAVSIADDIWVRGRYVRTKAFIKEQRRGQRLYKGRFGDRNIGTPLDKRKRAANEGLHIWERQGKSRLVVWDTLGLPYAMRGPTVNTRGITNLGGVICEAGELEGVGNALLAVERLPDGGVVYASVGRNMVDTALAIVFVETDKEGEVIMRSGKFSFTPGTIIEGFSKRFVVSQNYYIFAEIPVKKKGFFGITGLEMVDSKMPTKVSFITRRHQIGAKSFFVMIDSILTELVKVSEIDNRIDLDVVSGDFTNRDCLLGEFIISPGTLCRYSINVRSGEVTKKSASRHLESGARGCTATCANIFGCTSTGVMKLSENEYRHSEAKNTSGLHVGSKYSAFLSASQVVFVRTADLERLGTVNVEEMGDVGEARDVVWMNKIWQYDEWNKKGLTSWETFAEHEWNEVDSSFSGLGLNSLQLD